MQTIVSERQWNTVNFIALEPNAKSRGRGEFRSIEFEKFSRAVGSRGLARADGTGYYTASTKLGGVKCGQGPSKCRKPERNTTE